MIRDTVLRARVYEIEATWSDLRCPEREGDDFVSELGPNERHFAAWWFEPRWAPSSRSA